MNSVVMEVTQKIAERSQHLRSIYLKSIESYIHKSPTRQSISCGNLAHTVAACSNKQKQTILDFTRLNIGIITAYNDMVSAHQPYQTYPDILKSELANLGHSAQVAGGVAAMCDGITQGQDGMELSLFSRDNIAQSTAIALSHQTFDGIMLLGVCDKIVPGQLMGALSFGHLPAIFVPAGPMTSGISNKEKVKIRQQYAAGKLEHSALQTMECQAYHSAGTCTFYGTANTNQLVFESMGLMLPGSAFVPAKSELRETLTRYAAQQLVKRSQIGDFCPLGKMLDERSLVNGLVTLLASGGSTNHTIHMIAIARAAGFVVTWDDIALLSDEVPLLAKMYPNGPADINQFHEAGGTTALFQSLSKLNLLHLDARTVMGTMKEYLKVPTLDESGKLIWKDIAGTSNPDIISDPQEPFAKHGGLALLQGNLGRGVMKISAVEPAHRQITAPAKVFDSQHDVEKAYHNHELDKDCVIIVRHNGPAANGMPELHKLMPILGNLMDAGYQVALVTDGRLSGASGKVPSVLHVTPEASRGGPLSQLVDGDIIVIDAELGCLMTEADISGRNTSPCPCENVNGCGRELFSIFRHNVSSAEQGATILFNE